MMIFRIISQKLARYPQLKLAISTRNFGNLSFQHPTIKEAETIKNRKKFLDSQKIPAKSLINIALRHTKKIFWAENADRGRGALSKSSLISFYDGLITDQRNNFLMITVADCFPVFLFDPQNNCIGLIHVGWRGVLKNIVQEMVREFKTKKGSNPKNLIAFIGPGLKKCHFEVGKNLFQSFSRQFGQIIALKRNNKFFVDLSQTIKIQLENTGLLEANIEVSSYCTYCEKELFSSFRRDKDNYIAQGAIIGLID